MEIYESVESVKGYLRRMSSWPVVLLWLCSHGLAILRSLAAKRVPVVVIESNYLQPSASTRYGIKLYCPDLYDRSLISLLTNLGFDKETCFVRYK
jgi:hypothetical protein